MTDFRRSIKCSNCGNESDVYISSQFDLRDFMLSGKCSSCGNSLQLNFNVIEKFQQQESPKPTQNLDESIFGSNEKTSLSDIMDD